MPRKELEAIAHSFKKRRLIAGDVIVKEAKGGTGFVVIESGQARVSSQGKEIGTLGPGSSLGEIALVDEGLELATVTASTDMRSSGLAPWKLRPIVQPSAAVAWNLLQTRVRYLRSVPAGHGQPPT